VDICVGDSHITCAGPVDILKTVALLDRVMVAMVVCQECYLKLLHLMDSEDGGTALLRNVGNYQSTHRDIPEDCENLKSGNILIKAICC
jgi:hypothetical protein